MTQDRVDCTGALLPQSEQPSADKLRVYGDMLFLAFRSQRHSSMSIGTLRTYFQPPVELGQFRIFRFDDIPRGMYTWAMLTPDSERKLLRGDPLTPEEWRSGDRMWIMDIIAPYRGLTRSISRWIMKPGNLTDTEFMFRRVQGTNSTRKIVHVDFRRDRLSRIFDDEAFLEWVA